jgi:hypothetical protein
VTADIARDRKTKTLPLITLIERIRKGIYRKGRYGRNGKKNQLQKSSLKLPEAA